MKIHFRTLTGFVLLLFLSATVSLINCQSFYIKYAHLQRFNNDEKHSSVIKQRMHASKNKRNMKNDYKSRNYLFMLAVVLIFLKEAIKFE